MKIGLTHLDAPNSWHFFLKPSTFQTCCVRMSLFLLKKKLVSDFTNSSQQRDDPSRSEAAGKKREFQQFFR